MRVVFTLIVLLAASVASAQTYPTKPVRLVVGFAPGGAADIIARVMTEPLTRALGQGIIVDNKPGAGSSLAAEYVAKVAPDGYTIMIASQSGMIINPIVNKSIAYDTERDFVAITQVTSSPLVVAVHPSLPVNSIRELIAEAKKNPGKLNFATSGNGSLPHLATALFDALAGVEMVHIPYKSGGLSVQSVLAGDTQVTFATAPRRHDARAFAAGRRLAGNGGSGPRELRRFHLVRILRAESDAAGCRRAAVRSDDAGASGSEAEDRARTRGDRSGRVPVA